MVAILVSHANTMSKRQTYNSVEEMRDAMQGNWSHRSDYDYDIMWQLQIEGDKCTRVFASSEDIFESDITWRPSKGTFEIGSTTYIVTKGERTIEEHNYSYDKGGVTLTPGESSSSSSNNSYESVYSALHFSDIIVTSNSSYTVCTGKVTNNGKKTYRFVTIKGDSSIEDCSISITDYDN